MTRQPLIAENELLPIRVCRTARPDAEVSNWFSVFCPRRSGTVALSDCVECPECEGVGVDPHDETAFLRCRGSAVHTAPAPASAANANTLEQPDRVSVTMIMSPDTVCVDPELSLEALVQVFLERGISGAPVVDENGRPLGIVSKTDLLRDQQENPEVLEIEPLTFERQAYAVELGQGFHLERIREDKVADIMTPVTFTLSESASVARAAALMAYEGVHRVPVVSTAGRVVGIVSALDIARWVASASGYCIPQRR